MRSWKTTLAGILAIIVAVANAILGLINGTPVDFTALFTALMAGIGLVAAKDSNVSGAGK